MSLIVEKKSSVFDTDRIQSGDLIYAKHSSWENGKSGIVTAAYESQLRVQYVAPIGNVTNYFRIRPDEVGQGLWDIRWTKDLSTIEDAGILGGGQR